MKTIQVVVDEPLLRAADRVVRQEGTNRSALFREALREHLNRIRIRDLEKQEREAYRKQPDTDDDLVGWEQAATWPAD
jgi:metal-responsive CopG/Arc/MetJ family transcriptional regulator